MQERQGARGPTSRLGDSVMRPQLHWIASFAALMAVLGTDLQPRSYADGPTIIARPPRVELIGPEAVQQVIVEDSAKALDLTAGATFEMADPTIATVDASGLVAGHAEGETALRITAGGT